MHAHSQRWNVRTRRLQVPADGPRLPSGSPLRDTVARLASTSVPVLLIGEPGTGRRWVAQSLHREGAGSGPLLQLEASDDAAVTGERLEDLLDRLHGGSLFVPEIRNLPASWQAALAEHLASRTSPRLLAGASAAADRQSGPCDLRRDLLDSLLPVRVPPLCERPQDIVPTLEHLLETHAARRDVEMPRISDIAGARLRAYRWPGDHAELEQLAERALALGTLEAALRTLSTGAVAAVRWEDACTRIEQGHPVELDGVCRHVVRQVERAWVDHVIERAGGDLAAAAGLLGLPLGSLPAKLRDLGLERRA